MNGGWTEYRLLYRILWVVDEANNIVYRSSSPFDIVEFPGSDNRWRKLFLFLFRDFGRVEVKDVRGGNTKGADAIGKVIAERSIEKGIKRVVFDRGGFLYHGRIRAVAEAARKAGLEF